MDLDKLTAQLSRGRQLSDEELKNLVLFLEKPGGGPSLSFDRVYSCLYILASTGNLEYRGLLETFLDCKEAQTVSLVLEILCPKWGGTDLYVERLLHFALGVPWDPDGDLRQTACKILGEYLYGSFSAPTHRGRELCHGEKEDRD